MTADARAELRLHWLLGIALGLILGYAWGQYDAHNPPSLTDRTPCCAPCGRTDGPCKVQRA